MSQPQGRRRFLYRAVRVGLSVAGLALLGGCAVSPGEDRGGTPRSRLATIGFLGTSDEDETAVTSSGLNGLRQGLRELEWVEGENLRLEVRQTQGDSASTVLPDLVAELVRMPVDVIVTWGPSSSLAAAAATSTLPIVMVDPPTGVVESGLAASIQRPGGNVTGLLAPLYEIYGKRLELLVETVPHVSRVAAIAPGNRIGRSAMEEAARALGVQFQLIVLRSERDLELAFEVISNEAADAVLVQNNLVTINNQARIIDSLAQRRLPAIYPSRAWAEAGGLMSYGHDTAASYRRAAFYVDRILRGEKPGDLPIEFPTRYELVINVRTAAALGLTIPDPLLAQATEVIR